MNPHRTIVENAFARFSKFKILCAYRGKLDKHPYIFAVIAQIVQADIAFHPLRRDTLELPSRHWWFDYCGDAQSDFVQRLASMPLYVDKAVNEHLPVHHSGEAAGREGGLVRAPALPCV